MSRSAQNISSETVIYLTAASRDDDEPPAAENRRSRPRTQTSRKTVYKIMQQPSPSPPPAEDDGEQPEVSLSISLEETNVQAGKTAGPSGGSHVLRVLPHGASIVLEQVSTPPPRPASSSMPPRRKSLPASMPTRGPKPRSRPPSRSKSRPLSPAVIKVVQEQVSYESEPEPEPERESDQEQDSDEAELRIKFEIATRSGSEEEPKKPAKTPEPCLDCLEEFVRRKRAEKQRQNTDVASQLQVTMSNKRICSRRSSKSVASSSVQSYRCPKCMACKSCGSISISVPSSRK